MEDEAQSASPAFGYRSSLCGVSRLAVVLSAPLAACLASLVGALAVHGGDPVFEFSQREIHRLTPAAVNALVATAPDPRDQGRTDGVARCRAQGSSGLGNPWRCTLRYRGGLTSRYAVTIRPDGSYSGRGVAPAGRISGCCLAPGALP